MLTRYNVKRQNSQQIPDDEWMEQRFRLFKQYCLPSIINQTNQNFIWLIYFSSDTKFEYKELIESISKFGKLFHVNYVNNQYEMNQAVKKDIKKLLGENSQFVLTTRLDNDDALHKDAIKRIQKEAVKQGSLLSESNPELAINMKCGYCLKVEPCIEVISHHNNVSSPFMSLLEKIEFKINLSTVISRYHSSFYYQPSCPLIQIDDHRYWLQIIHGKNVSNGVKGMPILI